MKKLLLALCTACLCATACYNDAPLRERVEDLDTRLTTLEKTVRTLNGDLQTLQGLVDALQQNKTILSVAEGEEDGVKTWTITFSDKSTLTVRSGSDGKDGQDGQDGHSPLIGVRQDTDGNWYWTLDGDWLKDGRGNQVLANAPTPILKTEDGYWWISFDNGAVWTNIAPVLNQQEDPLIKDISYNSAGSALIFQLRDGTTITLPLKSDLSITFFDIREVAAALPGESFTFPYLVSGGNENNVVKALGQGGWIARVQPQNAWEGEIVLTAPDPVTECEALVWVSDGKGYVIMASINCIKATVEFADAAMTAPAAGGQVTFSLRTDIQYDIRIAEDWVTHLSTKALRSESLTFSVAPNPGERRSCRIDLCTSAGSAGYAMIVQEPVNPVYESDAFGIYGVAGIDWLYTRGQDQMNSLRAEGKEYFRFLLPGTMHVYEVAGIPAELSEGASFQAELIESERGEILRNTPFRATVLDLQEDRVKLLTDDKKGLVIRR